MKSLRRRPITASSARTSTRRWTDQQSVFWYRFALACLHLLFRFWSGPVSVIRGRNLPASGGIFLVTNHSSGIDPFVLGYTTGERMLRGPGKVELFKHPVWGYVMKKLGIFPLRRGGVDPVAVRAMVELYRSGNLLNVYPESGRSKTGEILPFDPAFTKLVLKLKAPLILAGIGGANRLLPIKSLFPRRGVRTAVAYGEVFNLSELYPPPFTPHVVDSATAFLRDGVVRLVAEAEAELERLATRGAS